MFLTMIFLLVFSLVGVTYDCTRISASKGYLKVAGSSAARTVFGNYNQELFREYGLLGYGGYDGMGREDLNREFLAILNENIRTSYGESTSAGVNIYRIKNLQSEIDESRYLTEKEVFYHQITAFLGHKAVSKATDALWAKISGSTSEKEMENNLNLAEKYESGEYEELKDKNREEPAQEKEEAEVADSAGGNPLDAFSHMMRDGILGMVCQEKELSTKEIFPREGEQENAGEISSQAGAADFLQRFIKNENPFEDLDKMPKGKNKLLLLTYGREVCPNYLTESQEGIQYAQEYLAAGKGEEKSNLASVVSRLLAVRALLNFSYVAADPVLQEKSLATATALAGFTGLPPVITGVQYTILLILSFQEACVDVTALLDGKAVPIIKNNANFKMKYEEICVGSRELFQKKAAQYGKEKLGAGLSISYEEYLTAFLLLVGEDTLRSRTLDVIQHDLREKYNQSFCIDECICEGTYQITYETDYVFDELPFLDNTQWGQSVGEQCQEVRYGYKSG